MLEILDARPGAAGPGLRYRGLFVHDPRRPLDEARDMVSLVRAESPGIVFVYGLGLGYHLRALAERWPDAELVVFEPDPELRRAYRHHALPDTLDPVKRSIVTGWSELNDLVTRLVVHGDDLEPAAFVAPGYEALKPGAADDFREIVTAARVRRMADDKTRREKGRLFLDHLANNTASVLRYPAATELRGALAGTAGFIVGSGPGLEKNGCFLKGVRGRGLVLAGSSALKPLLAMGVRPDAVVVVEAEDTSRFFRVSEETPDIVLALASASHPNHFTVGGFRKAVYHLTPGAAFIFGSETFVPQAGTSGSAAFTLGLLLGLEPLILVGQDQAFGGGKVHASGAPENEPTTGRAGPPFTVRGLDGEKLPTHSAFASSLHWYAETVRYLAEKNPRMVVLNANESGADIPGLPAVRLEETIKRLRVGDHPDLCGQLDRTPAADREGVRDVLGRTWSIVNQIRSIHRRNPAETGAAIDACRFSHPFLDDVFGAYDPGRGGETAKSALEDAEALILRMLEACD